MRAGIAGAVAFVLAAGMGLAWGQDTAAPAAPPRTVVLDTFGNWRMYAKLAPPVLANGETVSLKYIWLNYETPEPAEGWMKPEFDDYSWSQGSLRRLVKTRLTATGCLRGKFMVTDPGAVNDLKLSVSYRGGLIVYMNGEEVRREHIEKDKTVAEGAPGEERSLEDLTIPKGLLKKGVNVLGLEAVRTAYPEPSKDGKYDTLVCEIIQVRLTASDGSGLAPNTVRPQGFQVWNADPLVGDFDLDFGNPCEALRAVRIEGARNGQFTGKVVVGSTEAIKRLKVTPGALKCDGGSIAAGNVHIRYGIVWGDQDLNIASGSKDNMRRPYTAFQHLLGALSDEPLETFEVKVPEFKQSWKTIRHVAGQPMPVAGATVPVWITVKVPADAKAGVYTGEVTIEATGEKAVVVPVEMRVADYVLPDTQDYRTWVDVIECPDTSALEYNVPLWSEKHWEMIEQSFKLIGETGSRTVYIPLICHTNLGNEESMVRWIEKGEKFEYDFSIMERYLDVAEKAMGKPKLVIFVVWDHYMIPADTLADPKKMEKWDSRVFRKAQMAQSVIKEGGTLGHGPLVTVVNPETKKAEIVELPTHYQVETSKALWKPLFAEVRSRMKKRGLEEAMMLGIMSDAWVDKEQLELFKEVSDDAPWVIQSHEGGPGGDKRLLDVVRIGYQDVVWPVKFSDDGSDRGNQDKGKIKSLEGWKRKDLFARFSRFDCDSLTGTAWRHYVEPNITGDQRGQGRIGGDYWKVLRGKQGERGGRAHERYPESNWRNLVIPTTLLAPGPNGPVATNRMEMFREGIQECEARITIEAALDDEASREKLGPDLVKRCEEYLHKRHMTMWLSLGYSDGKWGGYQAYSHLWFVSSGWQERTAELYRLAGEVMRANKP